MYFLYGHPRNFTFKQKYQWYSLCFQTFPPFLMAMISQCFLLGWTFFNAVCYWRKKLIIMQIMTHKHLCYSVVSILIIFFTNVFFSLFECLWVKLPKFMLMMFGTQYTVNNLLKSNLKDLLNFLDHHSKQCFLDSPHIICPNIQHSTC